MSSPEDLEDRDAAAMESHHKVNAIDAHMALAEQIWAALRRLGVDQGQMLVHGIDAPVFTGAPLAETDSRVQDLSELIAKIPSTPSWPHQGLVVRPYTGQYVGQYDVVIGNLPYSDVRFTEPVNRARLLSLHETLIDNSLASTRRGGITAVIATHQVLDCDQPDARDRMHQDADLLGAVRLPSASLRDTDQTDQVVDLLLFRRRTLTVPQTPVGSSPFQTVVPTTLDGHTLPLNEYWTNHPDHVIGRLDTHQAPPGGTKLQVTYQGESLHDRLADVLAHITDRALTNGLRTTSHQSAHVTQPTTTEPVPHRPFDPGTAPEAQIDL